MQAPLLLIGRFHVGHALACIENEEALVRDQTWLRRGQDDGILMRAKKEVPYI